MCVDIENDAIKCSIYPFNNDNSSITVSHDNYCLSCSFGNEVIPHIDKVLLWGFTTLEGEKGKATSCVLKSMLTIKIKISRKTYQ